jgi:membrane protease YdiL (CAAX protease family)
MKKLETLPSLADRRRALLILVGVLLSAWTLWATVLLPALPPVEQPLQTLRSIAVRIAFWVLPCLLYARALRLPLTWKPWYFRLPPSPRHYALGLATTLAAGLAVSLDVARKLGVTPWAVWERLLTGETFAPPIGEFFEEFVFRGILLSEFLVVFGGASGESSPVPSNRARFWLANVAASLVFVGLHWPWWIYTEGFGVLFATRSVGVFLISLVLGMLLIQCRSLWPCVALHWLNNALSGLAP